MKSLLNILRRFRKNKAGATAIEYGLIAALIAVGVISGATAVGTRIDAQLACTAARMEKVGEDRAKIRFDNCIRVRSR